MPYFVQCQLLPILIGLMGVGACVKSTGFDPPPSACESELQPNISSAELLGLYSGKPFQIEEELVVKAYVVSSDREGNFFGSLYMQDARDGVGLQLETDLTETHAFYPEGSVILIKLKGLYLGKTNDAYSLGAAFTSFGNISIGRLPAARTAEHLLLSCEPVQVPQPRTIGIPELDSTLLHTLITIEGIQLKDSLAGQTYASPGELSEHLLEDCEGNSLILQNSGYSDFSSLPMPGGRGSITGVLTKSRGAHRLIIRSPEDLEFSEERCNTQGRSSPYVFISELADPENNPAARFVEIFNAGEDTLSLRGWVLRRYTNAQSLPASDIALDGLMISPGASLLISPNAETFGQVYGFNPDLETAGNTAADSNGDDNIDLVDPFGIVIDRFGRIGEDGSGTDHEFEDGRALRLAQVRKGNPVYTASEWVLFNDSGQNGTHLQPCQAPEDFSPGLH